MKDSLGLFGEELAVGFLEQKGYQILHRNWRSYRYEIDIIAEIEDFIVIVEVKTRTSSDFGEPYTFVSKRKQSFLVKAAQHYADTIRTEKEIRFDIISILIINNETSIEHIPSAFIPLLGM